MDMDRQKLLNMLGLCRISGNLKSGDAMCEEAIRQRKAELVLIDPKEKPDPMNDEKIKGFCGKLK